MISKQEYAKAAMVALMANTKNPISSPDTKKWVAKNAFEMAQAMIDEENRTHVTPPRVTIDTPTQH